MSRSSISTTGLGLLDLTYLINNVPIAFFEASAAYQPDVTRNIGTTGVTISLSKAGYTRSGVEIIHYVIKFQQGRSTFEDLTLDVWVKPPPGMGAEANRRLVAIGISHLAATGVAVHTTTKDVNDLV
ncbi:hypothetical protein TRAPUB_6765 [Trametes pubescens]|uniref:Uncharacterized protein n=1 Tax=Trametes pubescens TaxID=154538 RepID=A0A1M2V541_TRAPU|nr:hypothetical protein TRAPUB_6765 [Trametes pubescens]